MQLELFDWTQPTAQIHAFPADARAGHVDRLARSILAARTDALADRRWNAAVNRLVAELQAHGFDESIQADQVAALARAVGRQIHILQNHRASDDGAA